MSPDGDDLTPPPRRRMSDKERRRWPDERLDDLKDDVEEVKDEQRALAALYRRLAPLPDLFEQYMKTTDARLDRMHEAIEKARDESRTAHRNIAYGKDPDDAKKELPPSKAVLTWGGVAKVVTVFAAVFAPTAAVIVALIQALTS